MNQHWLTRDILIAIGVAIALVTGGCATISTYDEKSYEKITACKAEVLSLMNKATTPFAYNVDEIAAVRLDINKAYQYDRNRPLNRITVEMWNLLRDPLRDTYAGFFEIWEKKGTLHQAFIDEKKIQIGEAFDQMAQLESGKIR